MNEFLSTLAGGLLAPIIDIAIDGRSRLYWPYILASLVIAIIVYSRRFGGTAFYDQLLQRNVWLSRSALNDYAVIFLNSLLLVAVSSWLFANAETVAGAVSGFLGSLGLKGEASASAQVLLGALLTVSLFVVDDLLRWFAHYLHHRIPALWEFHKVHHSAEVLNFITAERFHPLEIVITSALITLSVGAVNGVFIGLAGDQLSVITLAGANVLWIAGNLIGGVLRHSPFWVSFGPRVERWLISPAMHQIHHSDDPRHFDRNFGGTLAVWDRWFGTIYIPDGEEKITYGIGPETARFRTLRSLYFRPVASGLKLIAKPFSSSGSSTNEEA